MSPGAAPDPRHPAAAGESPGRARGRWLWRQARQARGALLLAAGAPLASGMLLIAQAWLLAQVLDAAITQGAGQGRLLAPVLLIAGLVALRAGLGSVAELAGAHAAERVLTPLRRVLHARMLSSGPQWSRARVSGEVCSTLIEQVDALRPYVSHYLPALVAAACLPPAFAIAVMPVDAAAGLVLLATAPLIPCFMALIGWGAEAVSRRHLRAFARLSGLFADRLRGLATLRLHGRARAEITSVARATEGVRARTLAVLRIALLSSAMLELFAALGIAAVAILIGLGYLGYLERPASAGGLQAGLFCLLMAPEVYAPLRQLAAHYHDRAAALAATAEIERMFAGLPSTAAPGGAAGPDAWADTAPGHLRAGAGAGVGAAARPGTGMAAGAASLCAPRLHLAAPGRVPLLQQASLRLEAGEHVSLMGASGAGKTTLLETLAGLRAASDDIELDGRPLRHWPPGPLRERLVLISQTPRLFAASLADNIRWGRPDAPIEQLREAARMAGLEPLIASLPQGLATPLGDRGAGLSGGQAQQVALARLFLRDPGLILLDEPFAHLDPGRRAALLDTVLAYAQGRSLLLATHSEAEAQRLPRRLRLAAGRLVEHP